MNNVSWSIKPYHCGHCHGEIVFRVAYKHVQQKKGNLWEEIIPSASIVICPSCGNTFWIPRELFVLAQVKND